MWCILKQLMGIYVHGIGTINNLLIHYLWHIFLLKWRWIHKIQTRNSYSRTFAPTNESADCWSAITQLKFQYQSKINAVNKEYSVCLEEKLLSRYQPFVPSLIDRQNEKFLAGFSWLAFTYIFGLSFFKCTQGFPMKIIDESL